jgi:orotate phosphoribosyltransferase
MCNLGNEKKKYAIMRKKSKGKNQHEWRLINGQDKLYESTVVIVSS